MIRGLEYLSYEGRLTELGLFNKDKEVPGRPYSTFQHLKVAARELQWDFFKGHEVMGQGGMASN